MTTLRKFSAVLIVSTALGLTACGGESNQSAAHNDDHSTMGHRDMDKMPSGDTMTAMAMGRVISVNQANGMVTVEHGPIKAWIGRQ